MRYHTTTKLVIAATIICLGIHQFIRFGKLEDNTHQSWKQEDVSSVAANLPFKQQQQQSYNEIVFTQYGWFHPNKLHGLSQGRSRISKQLVDAILDDPRYNNASADYLSQQHTNRSSPFVVFLDVETCGELNWPYLGGDPKLASDTTNGRRPIVIQKISWVCTTIQQALQSPAMMESPHSRLVVLNCGKPQPGNLALFPECAFFDDMYRKRYDKHNQLVVVHLSAHKDQVHPTNDFGIPPLPVKAVSLNKTELQDIASCESIQKRTWFFSFEGRPRVSFPEFQTYFEKRQPFGEINKKKIHVKFHYDHYNNSTATNSFGGKIVSRNPQQDNDSYYSLLRNSIFAAAPRGDNLFSYRFSEILSAGSIPVVYADDWVLPYTKDVVPNWNDLAVFIPQAHVDETMTILNQYSNSQICSMQQKGLAFYNNYVKDSHGRLRGIMKVLDAQLRNEGHSFSAAPNHNL